MQSLISILNEMYANRKVYDFSANSKETFAHLVAKKFKEKCFQNDTLSEDFKEFVCTPENVNVRINYGYKIKILYNHLTLRSTFKYYNTYENGKYLKNISGEVDDYGNIKVTSAEIGTDYKTTTETTTTSDKFYSTTKKEYATIVGSDFMSIKTEAIDGKGISNEIKYIELSDLSKASVGLSNVLNAPRLSTNAFDKLIQDNLPKGIDKEVYEKNKKYYSIKPHTYNITQVEDYDIEEATLTIMPVSFDIRVEYKGKKYEVKDCESLDDIRSCGENSDKYNFYLKERSKYYDKEWKFTVGGWFAIICSVLPFLWFLVLWGVDCSCSQETYNQIGPITNLTIRIIGTLVVSIAMFLWAMFVVSDYFYYDFNGKLTQEEMSRKLKKEFKKQLSLHYLWVFLICTISLSSGIYLWFIL